MGVIINERNITAVATAGGTYYAPGNNFYHDVTYKPAHLMLENATSFQVFNAQKFNEYYGIDAYPTAYGWNSNRCVAADSGWEYDVDYTYINIFPYINIPTAFYTSIYQACRNAISTSYRIKYVTLDFVWSIKCYCNNGWQTDAFDEEGSSTYANTWGYSGTGYPCNWWYGNDIVWDTSYMENFYSSPNTYGFNHIQGVYNWSTSYNNQVLQHVLSGDLPGSTYYGLTYENVKFHGGTYELFYGIPVTITCRLAGVNFTYATSQANFNNTNSLMGMQAWFTDNNGNDLNIVSSPAYYVYRPSSTSYVYSTQLSTPSTVMNKNSSGKGTIGKIQVGGTVYYVHMANLDGGGTGNSISTNISIVNDDYVTFCIANGQTLSLNTSQTN